MAAHLLLAHTQKDLVPGYPDVTPGCFFFTLQLVHGSYYFALSQAYNSRTHSRNKQTCKELVHKSYNMFHLCWYREQDLKLLEKYSLVE